VTNTDYPSWGYMVENGATTIWELWNGDTANPAMNSHNHVMLIGDLNVWFYERLAGIRSAGPGFKKIMFKPEPVKGVDYVKASLETPYGKAASSWRVEGKKFSWDIEIPANTTATVVTPAGKTEELGSGKYSIECVLP
jgi:alpha-L-rhamnosidase